VAAILTAVEGGILPPGNGEPKREVSSQITRYSRRAGCPALRQAGCPPLRQTHTGTGWQWVSADARINCRMGTAQSDGARNLLRFRKRAEAGGRTGSSAESCHGNGGKGIWGLSALCIAKQLFRCPHSFAITCQGDELDSGVVQINPLYRLQIRQRGEDGRGMGAKEFCF
jgi:hypothetical protein